MAVAVRSLQDQINKAKENLKGVDENIKKLIGRDPSDARPGAPGGPGRRVSLGGAGPGVGRGRGAGFRRESEDWGDGPAVKRRGEIGLGARDRRVVTYRGRGRGRGLRRDEEEDEDELPHKPSLASSVIPTPTAKMTRKDSIDQLNRADEQSKKRNRRMFGMLLGTLQRFRSEEVEKQQQDKERRRSEIDKKLEDKVEEEKKAAAAERQELFKERRAKQAELRRLEYKLELAQLQEEWDRHNAHLMQFIQVKASPALFWCPKKHSKETLQLLKDSQDRLKKVFDKRRKDLEEEISVLEVTAESGKPEGGVGVGEGGTEGKGEPLTVQDMDDLPEDTGIEIGEEEMDTGVKDDGKEQEDAGKEELHDEKGKGKEEQGRSRRESESGKEKGRRRDSDRKEGERERKRSRSGPEVERKRSQSGPKVERKRSQSGSEKKEESSETAEGGKETNEPTVEPVEPSAEGEVQDTEGEAAVVRTDAAEEPMATEETQVEQQVAEKSEDWPMGPGEGDWEMVE